MSNKANEAFSEVKLDTPIGLNKPIELVISFQLKDTFLKAKEWWLHKKVYSGGVYQLKIFFPDDKPCKGFTCNIVNEFMVPSQKLNGADYIYNGGRPVLDLSCSLVVGQRLFVEWDW